MAQSAFIIRVPEAEPHVARLRERFDPSAKLGVPAHITLLFPFLAPERLTDAVLEQARAVAKATTKFAFRLAEIGHFPGSIYLAPDPAAPFITLTKGLAREFPEFPPYEGKYEGIIPHLTVAQGDEAVQHAAEAELLGSLPQGGITAYCSEIVLIESSSGSWQHVHVFPLAFPAPDMA